MIHSYSHDLEVFGFNMKDSPSRDEVVVRVKSLLTLLIPKGKPKKDFKEKKFKKAFKRSIHPDKDWSSSSSSSSSDSDGGEKK